MKDKNCTRGFTLMEVLVAVVILGLAYVAVLQNFSISLRNIARLEQNSSTVMDKALLFEHQLDLFERGEETELETGDTYVEGTRLSLVEITSQDRTFKTLRLIRAEQLIR